MMPFPMQNLQYYANDFDIFIISPKIYLIHKKFNISKKKSIPPLTDIHKFERAKFTEYFINQIYNQRPHFIFLGWKSSWMWHNGRSEDYPPESFYQKESHPTSVMTWGQLVLMAIVNSEYYCSQLTSNWIFSNLYHYFNTNWLWQEDNFSPCHSIFTQAL